VRRERHLAGPLPSSPPWPCPALPRLSPSAARSRRQALLREHLQGKKHVQAARAAAAREEGRFCEVCDIAFTSVAQLTEHCKGRKHRDAEGRQRGGGGRGRGRAPGGGGGAPPPWARGGGG